ncbi:MAG: VirB3 family type IV secretion system protein [Gammaproteobacteria bacterium]
MSHNIQHQQTPIILALTRRAFICALPYNLFICLLISGCVAFVWIDSVLIVTGLSAGSYLFCRILCAHDPWAIDILIQRLQKIGVCPYPIRRYFNARSIGAE